MIDKSIKTSFLVLITCQKQSMDSNNENILDRLGDRNTIRSLNRETIGENTTGN